MCLVGFVKTGKKKKKTHHLHQLHRRQKIIPTREDTPASTSQDSVGYSLFLRPNLEPEEISPKETLQEHRVVASGKTLIYHGVSRPLRRNRGKCKACHNHASNSQALSHTVAFSLHWRGETKGEWVAEQATECTRDRETNQPAQGSSIHISSSW